MESPTVGSVILASCLLKLGSYGLFRFSFLGLEVYFFLFLFCLFGFVGRCVCCFFSVDLKAVVAFSSVSHMTLLYCCFFSLGESSLVSCVLVSLAHGLVSSLLFFFVGWVYDFFGRRSFLFVRGLGFLSSFFPFWFVVGFLNSGIPLTLSFFGEFFSVLGVFQVWFFSFLFLSFGLFFSGWLVFFLVFRLVGCGTGITFSFSLSFFSFFLVVGFVVWVLAFWGSFYLGWQIMR